jgi:hypothetical protein
MIKVSKASLKLIWKLSTVRFSKSFVPYMMSNGQKSGASCAIFVKADLETQHIISKYMIQKIDPIWDSELCFSLYWL